MAAFGIELGKGRQAGIVADDFCVAELAQLAQDQQRIVAAREQFWLGREMNAPALGCGGDHRRRSRDRRCRGQAAFALPARSEERRVGKELVSTVRLWWV